jgi:hypothetical protein
VALPGYAVKDRIDRFVGQRILAAKLGVEIGALLLHLGQGVVDLIEEAIDQVRDQVLDRDPGVFPKGHFPVTVETAGRVDGHRQ